MKKKLIVCVLLALLLAPVIAITPVSAQDLGVNYAANLGLANSDQTPQDIAVNIIKFVMTFLAIIAVAIILLGGFKWMTAGGSEDKVAEAKKLIVAAVIGLFIIMSAWAITVFVMNASGNILSSGAI